MTPLIEIDGPEVPILDGSAAPFVRGIVGKGLRTLAAHAQGVGAVWRSGELSYDARVEAGLGLMENEEIVGFLYMGTPSGEPRTPPALDPADFVTAWRG